MFSLHLYRTARAVSLPSEQQAISGQDYVATQSTVEMAEGVAVVEIAIPILAVIYMILILKFVLITVVEISISILAVRCFEI